MELNRILFPAPAPTYNDEDFPGELIWVPRYDHPEAAAIPCMLLQALNGSSKVLLYFHGNAEDICLTYEILDMLRSYLGVHVLAMEYPGYGVYPGKPSADSITKDAQAVFDFLTNFLEVNSSDIFVFGRSIGSGPATWLARNKSAGALILMSAYTSIRRAVKSIAGSVAQYLVADRFKNIDHMPFVKCPTFILHGQKDKLIPYSHAQELHELCGGPSNLYLPPEMDHNEFDYIDDLIHPLLKFFKQCQLQLEPISLGTAFLDIPSGLFHPPPGQPKTKSKKAEENLIL